MFASKDLLDRKGVSATTFDHNLRKSLISLYARVAGSCGLHPLEAHSFEENDIPASIKGVVEMQFHCADAMAYAAYGVDGVKGRWRLLDLTGTLERSRIWMTW